MIHASFRDNNLYRTVPNFFYIFFSLTQMVTQPTDVKHVMLDISKLLLVVQTLALFVKTELLIFARLVNTNQELNVMVS